MSSESRIWEIRPFGSMRGGRALVIGLWASQSILFRLLYETEAEIRISVPSVLSCSNPDPTAMKGVETKKELSPEQREELLRALKARFEKNMNRHKGLEWAKVKAKLEANAEKLWSLNEMERTGGEPDVVGHDKTTGEYIFFDCSAESPKGRRSLCYDRKALESRKEHKPENSAIAMALAMGIELLTE